MVTESYTLQGLNAPNGVEFDEAVFKTELPSSGDGLHVVKATPDGGQSDSEQIRLNDGIPDESAVVVRIHPNNTVVLDTIIERRDYFYPLRRFFTPFNATLSVGKKVLKCGSLTTVVSNRSLHKTLLSCVLILFVLGGCLGVSNIPTDEVGQTTGTTER